jgi:hypothetical protein
VWVDILEASPAQPPTPPPPPGAAAGGCADVGYVRNVSVALIAPFGNRQLLDNQFKRRQSVFDGSLLATPRWIPPGWTERPENTRRPASGQPEQWTRLWSGPPPGVTGGHCTPSMSGLSLTQTPGEIYGQSPLHSIDLVESPEIHGVTANFSIDRNPGGEDTARLTWTERSQSFALSSTPACAGDTLPSEDTVLRFARSLAFP